MVSVKRKVAYTGVLCGMLFVAPMLGVAQGETSGSMAMGGGAYHAEMKMSMQKMHEGMMSKPMSGDADRDFVTMMIPHHQGAIDMAKIQLKYGKNEKLRKLATDIIAAQEKEIKEMQDHLSKMEKGTGASGAMGHH